jgi:hypothetical protein
MSGACELRILAVRWAIRATSVLALHKRFLNSNCISLLIRYHSPSSAND